MPAVTVCGEGDAVNEKSGVGLEEECGTIWMPFTGARSTPSVVELGLAVIVKPVAVMVNFT